ELEPVGTGELRGLDDTVVGQPHFRPGRHVAAGRDDAVVAERDADAGVGAEQTVLSDADDLLAPTRKRTHNRRSTADVGAVADDDSGGDAALDHRVAERSRVVVDEAFVHDGSAFGEVSTQAYPIGIADAHPCRDHVVGHPRELVDAADSDVHTHGTRAHACLLEAVDRAWTDRGPDDIGEDSEYALEALSVRSYETVREQVKAQVRVVRIARRLGEVVDDRPDHDLAYLANV